LKEVGGGARKLQFSDIQLQISTNETAGAQNFNFAPKFPKMGISSPNFVLHGEKFCQEWFLTGQKKFARPRVPLTNNM